MCGAVIAQGILCGNCDVPRRPRRPAAEEASAPPQVTTPAPPRPMAPPPGGPSNGGAEAPRARSGSSAAPAIEPFPKAPVVQFPVETASLAITSVVDLLIAASVPAILVGPDRSVKFVSETAKALFGRMQSELSTLSLIEAAAGLRVGELSTPATAGIRIRDRSVLYALVPLSGGASGAVLVFRYTDSSMQAHAPFVTYVRETVFDPLRSLRDSLSSLANTRGSADPSLSDAAAAVEQVLSSLEMAPGVSERAAPAPAPTVSDVVHRVAKRYEPYAELKGIRLQVDAQELTERFGDHERLSASLGILVDNSLHYVAAGGQVVIGVRWMEHKGKPLLLFFVMDNGPLVPDELRHEIFEHGFIWNPAGGRSGRGLFKTREFAMAHGGSAWVESRTGKACTFFLRVRPEGVE
jgi:signal transduction histidine kinase